MGRTTHSGPMMVGPKTALQDQLGQVVLRKKVDFTFADATFDTEIPAGSEIIEHYVDVIEAWDSVTSDVLDIGDGATANAYADNIDLATAGRKRGTADVSQLGDYTSTGATTIRGTITSVGGSLTQGAARLIVLYTLAEPAQT